ncbi:MAG: hypothetical protein ABI462_00355 [Ignavibacteria bacterium]
MKAVQAFVFGNIYISICAVVMVTYTVTTFNLYPGLYFYPFIFFATLTSYSFHWYLTPDVHSNSERYIWVNNNKKLLLVLLIISTACSLILIYFLRDHILIISIASVFTFFYSASKIPFIPFTYLKKIIVGKTVYLAIVWTYVTVVLPLLLNGGQWENKATLFSLNRFFLIYCICLLFDYRDKDEDREQNIRNIVGMISLRTLKIFYYVCLTAFFIFSALLSGDYFNLWQITILILPGLFLLISFEGSIKTKSDYWYYFYLDGLMMLSGIAALFYTIYSTLQF